MNKTTIDVVLFVCVCEYRINTAESDPQRAKDFGCRFLFPKDLVLSGTLGQPPESQEETQGLGTAWYLGSREFPEDCLRAMGLCDISFRTSKRKEMNVVHGEKR